jgi:hypothetical protein
MTVAGTDLFAGIDGGLFQTRDGLSWKDVGYLSPLTIEAMVLFHDALYVGAVVPPQAMLYRAALPR